MTNAIYAVLWAFVPAVGSSEDPITLDEAIGRLTAEGLAIPLVDALRQYRMFYGDAKLKGGEYKTYPIEIILAYIMHEEFNVESIEEINLPNRV